MIADAFHGPQPQGYDCRHLDGNKLNSRPENLAWGTRADNQRDRERHGTSNHGEANGCAKLTAGDAIAILSRSRAGETDKSIATTYGVAPAVVWCIKNGRTWSHATGVAKTPRPKQR